MPKFSLIPYDKTKLGPVKKIDADLQISGTKLSIICPLDGRVDGISWPKGAADFTYPTEGLYKNTCFELFVAGEGKRYVEFNFSPNGAWCHYFFDDYRENAKSKEISSPLINPIIFQSSAEEVNLKVELNLKEYLNFIGAEPGTLKVAVSTVIESSDHEITYWALRHPGSKPDFHDRRAFNSL